MNKRKYTIEATLSTLARFVTTAEKAAGHNAFILRVTPNSSEEYYYVVLLAEQSVHDAMKAGRFENSHGVL